LWGMVDGLVTVGKQLFIPNSYFVSIRRTKENGYKGSSPYLHYKGSSPYLAVLKALCKQWGIEGGNR
jgi:hypothetical protein